MEVVPRDRLQQHEKKTRIGLYGLKHIVGNCIVPHYVMHNIFTQLGIKKFVIVSSGVQRLLCF